jgi:ribosomal protein S18 acetylase RimI-like enzyme
MMVKLAATTPIREWCPEDFDALHTLDRACFPPPIAYSRRTLRKFLRLPGAECLVAECDGQLAGFILTHAASPIGSHTAWHTPRTPPCGHIISLDVDAQFRRHGVGSTLLRAAEELLAAYGVRIIHLETSVDNQPAIAFWRRHGYEMIGKITDYYGDGADACAMSRTMPRTMSRAISPIPPQTRHDHESEESDFLCTYTRPSFSPSSRD